MALKKVRVKKHRRKKQTGGSTIVKSHLRKLNSTQPSMDRRRKCNRELMFTLRQTNRLIRDAAKCLNPINHYYIGYQKDCYGILRPRCLVW